MFFIGMVLTVPMTIVFVAELFDYQVRFFPPGVVKMRRRWNAKAVTMMAMTAALSVILQAVSAVLVLMHWSGFPLAQFSGCLRCGALLSQTCSAMR
jgi:hypothetical protein